MANQYKMHFEYDLYDGKGSTTLVGIRTIEMNLKSTNVDICYIDKEVVRIRCHTEEKCKETYEELKKIIQENGNYLLDNSFAPTLDSLWDKKRLGKL